MKAQKKKKKMKISSIKAIADFFFLIDKFSSFKTSAQYIYFNCQFSFVSVLILSYSETSIKYRGIQGRCIGVHTCPGTKLR